MFLLEKSEINTLMRAKQYTLCLLVSVFGLFSCIDDNGLSEEEKREREGLIKVGNHVPSFTVYDDNGDSFSSTEFIGKRSLLLFFDIICGDCRREFAIIDKVWNRLKDDPDFCMITISRVTANKTREQDIVAINEHWELKGYTMPKYFDENRQVYNLFARLYVPRIYLIDAQGVVKWAAVEKFDTSVDQLVDKIKAL